MGVPVVTTRGTLHAGRVGASLLTTIGCPELIANDEDDYIRIARDLANSADRLAHYRTTLRERMQRSPLLDAPSFSRGLETALRHMWAHYCTT
jgi:protein O-GlcNAc transferase